MRNVYLYGHLKKEFGPLFRFDVATAAEAVRALNAAFPGKFIEQMRKGSYKIVRGRKTGGMSLDLDLISSLKLGNADLHIIPVAHGSGSKGGTIKAVLGVAVIGAAIFFSGGTLAAPLANMSAAIPGALGLTWGNMATLGLGLALSGISQSLAKADANQSDSVDPASSYTLSGPVNVTEQGGAVPLIYGGPLIVGSQPVSAGMDVEDVGSYRGGDYTIINQAVIKAAAKELGFDG